MHIELTKEDLSNICDNIRQYITEECDSDTSESFVYEDDYNHNGIDLMISAYGHYTSWTNEDNSSYDLDAPSDSTIEFEASVDSVEIMSMSESFYLSEDQINFINSNL